MSNEARRATLILALLVGGILASAGIGAGDGIVAKVMFGTLAVLQLIALAAIPPRSTTK